jgi:hypothetical protein
MWLLIRELKASLLVTFASAIRVCIVCASFLLSAIASSGEIEELSVTEVEGEYRLRIATVLDAPSDYVHRIITDYSHAYRINPAITEIEVLPSDRDDVVRVRHLSQHLIGPICLKVHWVGDIVETKKGYIEVKTVSELSSFESGAAI